MNKLGVCLDPEFSLIAITCAGVGVITGRSVIYDLAAVSADVYPFGTEAMFSCDEGLDLVGSPLSTCKGLVQAGEFTPSPPQCLCKWDCKIHSKCVLSNRIECT